MTANAGPADRLRTALFQHIARVGAPRTELPRDPAIVAAGARPRLHPG